MNPVTPDSLLADVLPLWWGVAINWIALANAGLRILVALFIAWLAFRGLGLLSRRIEAASVQGDAGTISLQEQRTKTLVGLVRNIGIVVIVVLTLFTLLGIVGVDIRPLLAGAGVIGLAISFGAQSLVRDVITGLFILFENQFGVGDVVRIGDVGGMVERMTLRVVVLRDVHGTVHVIPNGEIKRVSNMTRSWSRAVLEIGVAYKEDVDRVMQVMREVGAELWEHEEWRPLLIEEITVPGIESFGDSSVVIRMMAKTIPLKQWDVARELRRRLKNRFDAEGIEIPFPHRTLYWGADRIPAGGEEERRRREEQSGAVQPRDGLAGSRSRQFPSSRDP
ncbi:MAG: mechanosensitive ion channel [Gemmatimonadetes bacterium]|nr:mechanosensitive ion channel [Gemmatimonadota bacterium]